MKRKRDRKVFIAILMRVGEYCPAIFSITVLRFVSFCKILSRLSVLQSKRCSFLEKELEKDSIALLHWAKAKFQNESYLPLFLKLEGYKYKSVPAFGFHRT